MKCPECGNRAYVYFSLPSYSCENGCRYDPPVDSGLSPAVIPLPVELEAVWRLCGAWFLNRKES